MKPVDHQQQTYDPGIYSVVETSRDEFALVDADGRVVASRIRDRETATLFAYAAPLLDYLEQALQELQQAHELSEDDPEVLQATWSEIAEDRFGTYERRSPGMPDHARWLVDIERVIVAARGRR